MGFLGPDHCAIAVAVGIGVAGNDFNFYYHVSFIEEDEKKGKVYYNDATEEFMSDELPGFSVFYKNENDDVFHTYSTYARGLDSLVGAYNLLDLTPKVATKIRTQRWIGCGVATNIEWQRTTKPKEKK